MKDTFYEIWVWHSDKRESLSGWVFSAKVFSLDKARSMVANNSSFGQKSKLIKVTREVVLNG